MTINVLDGFTPESSIYILISKDDFVLNLHFASQNSENTFIGDLHLNLFSVFFNDFKRINTLSSGRKGLIKISFSNDVVNFDIGLISLIALFRFNFKNVKFELSFPQSENPEIFLRFRDILFGLRSWYESLTGDNLYSIKNESLMDKEKINEPEGVLPIILITPKTFYDLFIRSNSTFDVASLFDNINKADVFMELEANLSLAYAGSGNFANKNYRAIRDTIRKFQDKIDWKNNHRVFFQHYLRMLSEFDLLPEQISFLADGNERSVKLEGFKKRGLKEIEMNKLKKELKEIILKLRSEPPIMTLIFSILVNRNLEKAIEDVDDYVKRLNELFEFSRNLFLGVRELTRNIVEHTDSRTGFFSGRIYSGDTIRLLKGIEKEKADSETMKSYFSSLATKGYLTKNIEEEYFLDLLVYDEGQKGIIKKTIENIEFLKGDSEEEENMYVSDLRALKSGEITFKDFYNSTDIKLNHHAVKASSHWGLIIFTNLINKNNGLFIASTYADSQKKAFDSCYKFDELINSPARSNCFFAIGSFYNIILPLDKNFNLKEDHVANTVPKESNFSEKNFIELLNYKYEKKIKPFKDEGKYTLLQIRVHDHLPPNLVDEYRIENEIAGRISDYLKLKDPGSKKFIPVFDFDGCEDIFDQSKLFRFFAELQKRIDIYSTIIINIKQDVIRDLFKTLTEAFPSDRDDTSKIYKKAFWNKEHFILIYSYEKNTSGSRIYFTDILGGYSYYDFFLLNNKIASTHFTYPKFSKKIETGGLSDATRDGLKNSPLYISESGIVQNFEMVIEHDNKSLFEHSIEFILNQEI